jgi:signal transduction histidine kinase/ligand-binding sensor domain-containing protein/CheY-like chemotaxis protein/AraC-like DNA-binding protein
MCKKPITFVFFVAFLFWVYSVRAAEVYYEQFDVKSGLPSNEINCLEKCKEGYLWIGTSKGFARYDGYHFIGFNSQNLEGLEDDFIKTIVDLNDQYLLLGTYRKGILFFDKSSFSIISLPLNLFPDGRNYRYVTCAHKVDSETIWLGTASGVLKLRMEDEGWKIQDYTYLLNTVKRKNVITLYQDSSGALWIATQNEGVVCYRPENEEIKHYSRTYYGTNNLTQSINVISEVDGELLMGGYPTLIWLDRETDQFKRVRGSMPTNNVTSMVGMSNKFWVAAKDVGLIGFNDGLQVNGGSKAQKYTPVFEGNQFSHLFDNINALLVDPYNSVWIGTSFNGLVQARFVPEVYKDIHPVDKDGQPGFFKPTCLLSVKDKLWVGSIQGLFRGRKLKRTPVLTGPKYKGQVFCLAPQTDSTFLMAIEERLLLLDQYGQMIKDFQFDYVWNQPSIWSVYQYNDSTIYFGTYDGAFRLHTATMSVDKLPLDFNKNKVWIIQGDSDGAVWFSAFRSGLARFNPETNAVDYFNESNDNLPCNEVNTIMCGKDSSLWLGTRLGLYYYESGTFKNCEIPGLRNTEIRSINGTDNRLWLGQKNGFVLYDQVAHSVKQYPIFKGSSIFLNYMSGGAALSDDSSSVYVIAQKHVRKLVLPEQDIANRELKITELLINNRRLLPNVRYDGKILLEEDINKIKRLVLARDENNISISLSGLNYSGDSEYYAYKLEDEDEWHYLSTGLNSIKYVRLSPGTYNLSIRQYASLNSEAIAEKTIEIVIRNHFLLSLPAMGIYMVVLLLIFLTIYYIIRLRQSAILEQERQEQKLNFYTDMSHETRTPLTLVIDAARRLMANKQFDNVKEVKYIFNNANRLMQLMDRVLELRKIDTKYASLDLATCNAAELIENYCAAFVPEMKQRQQNYSFENQSEAKQVHVDPFKLERIVFNLMSNATKYTPNEGDIEVVVGEVADSSGKGKILKVTVSNSGPGISAKDLPYVFKRFYGRNDSQYIKSSGVGLDLTQKLVELHGGTIEVDSKPGIRTLFTFTICVNKEELVSKGYAVREIEQFAPAKSEKLYEHSEASDVGEKKSKVHHAHVRIMVVEDNTDLLMYITEMLKPLGAIVTASNGAEAYELIQKNVPSLIVSDLMMPVMDGAELCRKVKTDIRYKHVPFLLLTASDSELAKKDVYEAGADGFITKPFNSEILFIRIKRMIEDRSFMNEQIKEWSSARKEVIETEVKTAESYFVKRVKQIVMNHLSDPEFDVNVLAEKMKMGKTSFYNKLKDLTGKAPIEYINYYRLKQGKEDLLSGKFTVSEVAYNLGYNDPSYFARVFKKEFGCTPTQFLRSVSEDQEDR